MIEEERGILPSDFDEIIARHVERIKRLGGKPPKNIWFDCAFFLARDYDLLDKWWEIQEFGRKSRRTKKKL